MSELPVQEAVAAMETYTGTRPGYRRAHARGLVVRGSFQATPEAAALTTADHFQGGVVPVVARLSNAGGDPFGADRVSATTGRALGLGVRFMLPSGAVASWAAVNIPAFPARTPQDFVRLTALQKPFLSMRPNPFKLIAYLLSRPSALPAIKGIAGLKPTASFAGVAFNGIHTYFFVDRAGQRRPFRYRWVPRAGTLAAPFNQEGRTQEGGAVPRLYLLDEFRNRLASGPALWDLILFFPQPSDRLDDATCLWPADRQQLGAGSLILDQVDPDQRGAELLVFDPTGVVSGIDLSDDPLLRFRAAVYSESYRRRSHETRTEPPPPDLGQ